MTTQDLYSKLVAGDVTEQKFLYEVRRDPKITCITPSNNFKDTVKILKNRGIISEKQAKLSTGKQEVDIIAKTIDMVNPYEYARGMDLELGVENEAVGNSNITEDDIKKAQKKVLKNLTKDANYYSKKNFSTMGDSEYAVEVNAKSIEALKKKAGKIIREHGEDYEAVSKVMGNVSQLEEDDKTQAFVMAMDMFKNAKGTADEKKALDNLKKVSKDSIGVELPLDEELNEFDDSDITTDQVLSMDKEDLQRLSLTARSRLVRLSLYAIKRAKNPQEEKEAKETFVKVSNSIGAKISIDDLREGDTDYDRAKDAKGLGKKGEENIYGAGVKKGEEIAAKKMAAKRESIYEKYAEQYNVDVNEVKDRLEAYKLEKEAIEVEDEDTAIAVQKKSPDADVRIIEK